MPIEYEKPTLKKENSLAKLAAKVIEAVAAPKTPTGGQKEPGRFADLLKRLTDPVIKKENAVASRWTQLFTSENPASRTAAETSIKKESYPKRTPEAAKRVVEQAAQFARDRTPDVPAWIPTNAAGEVKPESALTAEFMLRVSTLPPELRTPQILYREAARLYHSADYKAMLKDPKLDPQVREINQYIDATLTEVQKQAGAHPEFKFKAEEPAVMRDKLSREFDIYRSRRLPPPEKVEEPTDEDDEGTAEWALEKRRDALDARLRKAQQTFDTLEFESRKNDELKELLHLKQELEDNAVDANLGMEKWMKKDGQVTRYNDIDVEEYVRHIEKRVELLKQKESWHPVEVEQPTPGSAMPSGERPYAGMLSGFDIKNLPPDLQETWYSMENFVNNAPQGWVNEAVLTQFARNLESLTRDRALSVDQQAGIANLIQRLKERIRDLALEDQIPNQIAPTLKEFRELSENGFSFIDGYVRDIERIIVEEGPDNPTIQSKFVRYRLLTDLFSSRFLDEKLLGPIPEGISAAELAAFKIQRDHISKLLLESKIDILGEFNNRIDHAQAIYYAHFIKDFEKDGARFQETINRISDERAYAARSYHGGLVDTFVNGYLQRQFRLRQIDLSTADPDKLTPRLLNEIYRDATAEFLANIDDYRDIYGLRMRARYASLPRDSEGKSIIPLSDDVFTLTREKMEAAALTARVSARLFMQTKGWQNFGMTPQEGAKAGKQNEFWFSMSWEERLNRANFVMWRRRWGSDDPQRAMLCAGADMVLKRDKTVRTMAEKRADEWFNRLQAWRTSTGSAGETARQRAERLSNDKFYAQLQVAFSEYYKRLEMGTTSEDSVDFFLHIDEKKFRRQIALDTAMTWQEENGGPRIYDVLKSVYVRQGAVKRELKESSPNVYLVQVKQGVYEARNSPDPNLESTLVTATTADHADRLTHGLTIYARSKGWFFPNIHERSHRNKEELVEALAEGAWSHPHELALLEFEHEGPVGTKDYYDPNELKRAYTIFGRIQSLLMLQGSEQINYQTQGFDERQEAVITKVFGNIKPEQNLMTREQYFAVMKKYAHRYAETGGVERFTDMKYANRFREILWYDDMPLSSIDTKDLYTQSPDRGAHTLISRAWVDTAQHGMKATDIIDHSLNFDEETVIKDGMAARATIKGYQGPEDAASAHAFIIGRHAGVGNHYVELTSLIKGGVYESIAQRLGTEADVARAPDETMEFLHKAQKGNKVGEASPYWEEGMMLEAKITDWRSKLGGSDGWIARMVGHRAFNNVVETLNEKLPTRWTTVRFGNTILFISAIGGIFVFAQAQKGGKEGAH